MIIRLEETCGFDNYCICPRCGEYIHIDIDMPYCEKCGSVIDITDIDIETESCFAEGIFDRNKKGSVQNSESNNLLNLAKFNSIAIQTSKIGTALMKLSSNSQTTTDLKTLISGLKDAKKEIDVVISGLNKL